MVEIALIQISCGFFVCLFVCIAKVKMRKEQLGAKKSLYVSCGAVSFRSVFFPLIFN